jgi:hypothetical protein
VIDCFIKFIGLANFKLRIKSNLAIKLD